MKNKLKGRTKMTDLKYSHTFIKTVSFISMLFFMTGTMLVAADEFHWNKYLRVIGIIPVCIALVIPYCTENLKGYSKLILGVLSILSYGECIIPRENFFVPYANEVMLSKIFGFITSDVIVVIIALLTFAAFGCMFLNMKRKKIAVWALMLLNVCALIYVLIKDPLWINTCDYYFSGSYIMLLLSVLISFDISDNKESNTHKT